MGNVKDFSLYASSNNSDLLFLANICVGEWSVFLLSFKEVIVLKSAVSKSPASPVDFLNTVSRKCLSIILSGASR